MVYYDVKALFTSVPVDVSIFIVQRKLQQGLLLSPGPPCLQIITLLEFCINNTHFLLQGKYFEQVHGPAMSSHISALIVNLFMEEFEVKAISLAPIPAMDQQHHYNPTGRT